MVAKLNTWVQSLIVAIAITTIIEMILPEGNNKKYVKIVCSIYILFTIISPILNITKYDFENLENIYEPTIQTSISNEEEVINVYMNAYENEIKQELIKQGFNIRKVKLNLDNSSENISNIEIETYYISEEDNKKLVDKIKYEYKIENIIIR
ncbi:MAG: stage III sporulation protein AF [Candidatus Scatovivens sp.]